MKISVGFLIRRWWWRKWHPAVRVGWIVARRNTSGSRTQTVLGIMLIGAGLLQQKTRRSQLVYATDLRAGREVRVRLALPQGSAEAL